jgi:N-carbamoylputrescine amidase
MTGHSASNIVPVVASNRIGTETFEKSSITFYGSSFITDTFGAIATKASRDKEEILYATLDLAANNNLRREWGLFRDRRPSTYSILMTKDGSN